MPNKSKKDRSATDQAEIIFRKHGGMMRMVQAIEAGITRNTLYAMRDSGIIETLARGLYRLASLPPLSSPDLVTVGRKFPQSVVYLISALSFHDLTTQIPHEVWIAVPRNSEPPQLSYPPLRVARLSGKAYKAGIEDHFVDGTRIRVYSREKTLVDCFRRRNDIGLDVAIEAVRAYKSQGKVNVDAIMKYANDLRATQVIRPYLEALL